MNKLKCFIYAPVDTYSGYSSHSRDKIKSIIELYGDKWNIEIFPCRWGQLPQGFIEDHKEEWGFLTPYLTFNTNISYQPDIMIWITVPNEFQRIGKYNIGITAGIETTICDPSWIEGINRMDLNLISSNHSKNTFLNSKFDMKDQQGNPAGLLEANKPMEVLFEGISTDTYKPLENPTVNIDLDSIKEDFVFLYTGHWLHGDIGEDRKNTGLLIKAFFETFKNKSNPPALLLKTTITGPSYMDRREILRRIDVIKKTCSSDKLPKIYLFHGDVSDQEINELYNHPKIKAMVNLTKGEGFGRPLLEFSLVNKPIITTNWSGHIDFLKSEFTTLLGGTLTNVHPSAAVKNMILPESQWFSPNHPEIGNSLLGVYNNYKKHLENAKRQGFYSRTNFSYEKMKEKLKEILDKNIPEFPKQIELKLPQLKKIELPKLNPVK
jgi:hypothetical protein